jgi:hypothetical protein
MMLKKMANLEVLEIVATLDFAHRHMNQATFNDGRRIAKNPEAESFLMELHQARQPTARLQILSLRHLNRSRGTPASISLRLLLSVPNLCFILERSEESRPFFHDSGSATPPPHTRLFPFPSMSLEYQITLARLRERERRPRLG